MAVTLELGASHLESKYEGLNVHVAPAHFTPKQWERLWEMLKQAQGRLEWLRLPFQTSKQEGARWKKICLDVFSMVVYILLIPVSHKLVQLIHPIDWSEIDQRCAKLGASYITSRTTSRTIEIPCSSWAGRLPTPWAESWWSVGRG